MDIKFISDDLSVSAQITVQDIDTIKAAGFKTIMCNRPESEEANQPRFSEIALTAEQAGLDTQYLPVISGQLKPSDVTDFAQYIQTLDKPILAYCRTGTRSTLLWALSQIGQQDNSVIINTAQQAGYDVAETVTAASGTA